MPTIDFIRSTLLHGQAASNPSVTTKLFFPYHIIPGEIRMLLRNVLFRENVARMRKSQKGGPASYADDAVDEALADLHAGPLHWAWPGGKRCALVLSHDTDTAGQERGVTMLWRLAERHRIPSTISFVGRFIEGYADLLEDLKGAGIEIALHDVVHTNDIAFLDRQAIVERLAAIADLRAKHGIRGFRSPSWYVSADLWLALRELGFDYDMSALDTWPFFANDRNFGVRTFMPFSVKGLVVLPNTIPFDDLPGILGYSPRELLAFWKPKIDAIAARGGLIMLNAHPDRWLSGNPRMQAALSDCLSYILDHHDPAVLSAGAVARHFHSESARGAVVAIPGTPTLTAAALSRAGRNAGRIDVRDNPCHTSRRHFLER